MSNKLTERENALYTFMRDERVGGPVGKEVDVLIVDMHEHLYNLKDEPRLMQQRVGAIISKFNRRALEFTIVPGHLKRTYRRKHNGA